MRTKDAVFGRIFFLPLDFKIKLVYYMKRNKLFCGIYAVELSFQSDLNQRGFVRRKLILRFFVLQYVF